ncbi:MAG: hypothetical protein AWM53_01461 [Candidatus Dichloromethanomonas elyunquensis]|nr:MAG: hypothetical protein AWM53_01461 [Candidatus Dichloromethanomonas elyunquensis]
MSSRRTVPAAIIGLIIVSVTLLIFFVAVTERHAIQWAGLGFIILAELVGTGGVIFFNEEYLRNTSGVMLRAGGYSLLFLYFLATAAVSVHYISGYGGSIKWLVTLNLIILAFTAVIMILIFVSSRHNYDQNYAVLRSVAMIKQISDSVMLLKSNIQNSKYRNPLEKIHDALRYCDNSVYVSTDDLIKIKINYLEEILGSETVDKDEKVRVITDEILLLAKRRAAQAKEIKAGGI